VGGADIPADFSGIPLIRAYGSETGRLLWQPKVADGQTGATELEQELRSGSDPLQSWQCEPSALEDEAPLELPPGASLIKPFTFHQQIRHQT